MTLTLLALEHFRTGDKGVCTPVGVWKIELSQAPAGSFAVVALADVRAGKHGQFEELRAEGR